MKHLNHSSTLWIGLFMLMGISLSTTAQAQVQSLPYAEDFETFSTCTGSCGSPCTLTNGWLNPADDQADWTVDSGGTSSSLTGPSVDHNPGTSSGNYLYFETSTPCNGGDDTAHLVSPPIDLGSAINPFVSYWYHLYGQTMGEFHVDLSNDGGATWQLDITPVASTDSGDVWLNRVLSLSAWNGDTIHLRFRGISGSNFYSDMAVDDVSFFQILPLDAALTDIPAPTSPAIPGSNAVEAVVSNNGTDTLTSLNVSWEVNGVAQTTLSWAGTLLPGASSGSLSLGSANFPAGFNTIKAWTAAPNGGVDQQNGNDTLEVSVLACNPLSGSYTVGGSGADFPAISDAAFALMNCGISGPVTMNVNPGTYLDHLELGEISGASAVNTITFDGGSATTAIIEWNGSAGVPTVYLNGTDFTTLKNLTIRNTATIDAWGVRLADTASYNIVDSCIIEMDPNATGDADAVVASAEPLTGGFNEGLNALHCTFSNNTISGGDKGFHFEGDAALPYAMVGIQILNNTIVDPNLYGFYLDNMDSLQISGNVITDTRSTSGDGIYGFDLQNFVFSGNNFRVKDWGIYISDGNFDYPVVLPSFIANNMVYSSGDDAIYLDDVEKLNMYHNTFVGTEGAYFNDIDTLDIRNNIFFGPSGKAVDFVDATSGINVLNFDYNLLFTGGANLADDGTTTYPDLASWQTGSPLLNANSVEGDPVFVSPFDDLHLLGTAADGVGTPITLVNVDIDGDPRDPTNPDIGADEYTPLTDDASPVAILTPTSFLCGDNLQEVTVVVFNGGANTITSMPINADVSGDVTATLNFTYTDTLLAFSSDTVVIGTINTFNGGTFDISLSTALAGDQDPSDDTLATQTFTVYPVIPTAMEDTIIVCGADTADLMANAFQGANYVWYDSLTGGSLVGEGAIFTVPSIGTQNTYFLGYGSLADSLSTTYAAGNGAAGNMFDVVSTSTVVIDSFLSHGSGAGAGTIVEVYYKTGSYVGSETTAADWTLLGTDTVDYLGNGTPVVVNIGGLTLAGGQTYGIYFTVTSGSIDYTNGANTYTDGTLTITTGAGKGYPFGSTFSPRSWNGTIFYGGDPCSFTRVPVTALTDTLVSASFSSSAAELTATFTDLSTGAPLSWEWDFGDGNTDTVVSPMHSYQFPGTYTVSLVVSDDCGTDTVSQTITVSCAAPAAGFSAAANDLEISFTDTSTTGGVTTASYLWDFGDGNTSTMEDPVHTYAAPGTYTVCLTVVDTCGTDTVCSALTVTCAAPMAGFDFTTEEDTVSFASMSTGTDTLTLVWDFGDGSPTSTEADPTHVYDSTGNYTVCLIARDLCGSDTTCQVVNFVATDIDDLLHVHDLQLYPNPTGGQFVLRANISQPVGLKINLFDPVGKLVYQKDAGRVIGAYQQEFDLSALPSGIYLLQLESEGRSTTLKVMRY